MVVGNCWRGKEREGLNLKEKLGDRRDGSVVDMARTTASSSV